MRGIAAAIIQVYTYLIIARAIGSFFIRDWSRGVPRFLWDVTEPALGLVRRFVPPISGLDFSPMIAILALYFLGVLISGAQLGL